MNILIVEDDDSLSELMQIMFQQEGYSFRFCISIEDAYLQLINIDVVIVDSFLGKEFSFITFCKNKGIYSVYHTGRMDITDEEYHMFDCVVQKPGFDFLLRSLRNISSNIKVTV